MSKTYTRGKGGYLALAFDTQFARLGIEGKQRPYRQRLQDSLVIQLQVADWNPLDDPEWETGLTKFFNPGIYGKEAVKDNLAKIKATAYAGYVWFIATSIYSELNED